jgi:hypothetical protein
MPTVIKTIGDLIRPLLQSGACRKGLHLIGDKQWKIQTHDGEGPGEVHEGLSLGGGRRGERTTADPMRIYTRSFGSCCARQRTLAHTSRRAVRGSEL